MYAPATALNNQRVNVNVSECKCDCDTFQSTTDVGELLKKIDTTKLSQTIQKLKYQAKEALPNTKSLSQILWLT